MIRFDPEVSKRLSSVISPYVKVVYPIAKKVSRLRLFFIFLSLFMGADLNAQPPLEESAKEPVIYVGREQTDKFYHHGGLRHAVGVHRYQVFRANRSQAPEGGLIGWTYSHAPMLAYWNDTFYLQYLSNLKEEHNPPARTLLITSKDGRHWSNAKVVFPQYSLPEIRDGQIVVPAGTPSVMHQRMGFYVAPNGRLLTIGFYSYCPTPRDSPNTGKGLGRVVREIYHDGSFGPIYFIRYNRHAGWNESNTPHFPFYQTSSDQQFKKACDDLLKDKLMTAQWWEMDQAKDGFYTIDPENYQIKALSYYHRPDGIVVGLWKYNLTALSPDDGLSWTPLVKSMSLKTCGAKLWGQRSEDNRYAIIYNHSASLRNRFPLVIITGDDGHRFDNMLCVHGEVPPMRYQGIHKNYGSQYIRGIVEGNGDPPGRHIWITYSMNKEDIWVTRVRIPVSGVVKDHIEQDFERVEDLSQLALWNFHIPKWAPIDLATDPDDKMNTCLRLTDEEPYDYALAERTIPESKKFRVTFRIMQQQVGNALLEFEMHSKSGIRPMRLRFDPQWLAFDRGKTEPRPVPIGVGQWLKIRLDFNCGRQSYDIFVDGKKVKDDMAFAEKVESLERLVFRSGPWRSDVRLFIVDGEPGNPGLYQEDLPGADIKAAKSVFLIDDIKTSAR